MCFFSQSSDDKFDWIRQTGKTVSANTGPTNDHTIGKSKFLSSKCHRKFHFQGTSVNIFPILYSTLELEILSK